MSLVLTLQIEFYIILVSVTHNSVIIIRERETVVRRRSAERE